MFWFLFDLSVWVFVLQVFLFSPPHRYLMRYWEWVCQELLLARLSFKPKTFLELYLNDIQFSTSLSKWIYLCHCFLYWAIIFWEFCGIFINEIKLYFIKDDEFRALSRILTETVENHKIRNQNSWIIYIGFVYFVVLFFLEIKYCRLEPYSYKWNFAG